MASKHIDIPGIGKVSLYKRRGNRSLRLSIASDGEVRVSMPFWLPYGAGERFAIQKAAWIQAHRQPTQGVMQEGQAIGKAHRLHFNRSFDAERISSRLKNNQLEVTHPISLAASDPAVQKAARTGSIRALRREAEQLLPYRLRQLAERGGFTYGSTGIKQLKGRWGSCTSQQDITLNLYLMQLPWHLIDYVIFHELTHTKVMHHGADFWCELERHVPHAKALRKEINNYHPILTTPDADMA